MDLFNDIVKVEVNGKNIDNYIKKIIKSKINIIKLKKVNYRKIYLYISYSDYLKLREYRTLYEIKLISKLGKYKIEYFIKKNIVLFISVILGIFFLYFLSSFIFDIEVIHSNSKLRKLVYEQLDSFGIKKYRLKKSYEEIEKIKDKILEDNKDNIEWIEIIESGTKYIVRLEERIKNNDKKDNIYQDIVASKSAIIKEINAISGEKVKNELDYVIKGDVIITGNILKPDNSSVLMHAEGNVFGETWYTVDVEYPYIYKEENLTGKSKKVLVLNFLNRRYSVFDFNKFNTFRVNDNVIFSNNMLPISLNFEKQFEMDVIDDYLTEEEAIDKAIEKAKDELMDNNKKIKEIIDVKVISKNLLSSKVVLKLFVSVVEDIGINKKIDFNEVESEKIG